MLANVFGDAHQLAISRETDPAKLVSILFYFLTRFGQILLFDFFLNVSRSPDLSSRKIWIRPASNLGTNILH